MKRQRKPAALDLWKETVDYWRAEGKRIDKTVRLDVDEDHTRYRLMNGGDCVFEWSGKDPMGDSLAHFLAHDLIATLRALVMLAEPRKVSPRFQRPARYRPFILEELAKVQGKAKGSSLVHLVHQNTLTHLKRLEQKQRLYGLKPTVSKTYVARVLREGYSKSR